MSQPVVTTRNGTLRGSTAEGSVAVFRGIPYAAAPVGANRFRVPQPVEPWSGVRDASQYGPTAPKAPYAKPFDQLIPEADIAGEEYLNLNVWTTDPAARLPVMVWLHGGAFANGSGSVPGYDGTRFARDGVVLVTVNYRLGADGFGRFGDTPANLGLRDQIAALRWVQDNITAFGGDPDRITVFGESAGAMSIGTLLAVPQAAGLFHRAVLQSGAAHHTLSPDSADRISRHLAELLDVPPTREAVAAVPVDRLVAAQQQLRSAISARPDPAHWGEAALNLMPFEPVVDGTLLPELPIDRISAGSGAEVDLLIGTNSDEFRLFLTPTGVLDLLPEDAARTAAAGYGLDPDTALAVYRIGRPKATPGELLAATATDWFYRIPAIRLAEAHLRHRAGSTFLYEFAWQPPTFEGRLGACHASELPFVFGNLQDKGFTALIGAQPPQHLADTMHGAWVSFATTGDPGWAPYDTTDRTTMRFDTTSTAVTDPRAEERILWDGHR